MSTSEAQIRVGDVGTVIPITILDEDGVAVDVSAATTMEYIFLKPDNVTQIKRDALLNTDGTDGKLKYTLAAGDLPERGTWQVEAHVVTATGEWWSSLATFEVGRSLKV